ncbi:SHOCT domain-containing protein [Sulfurimonas sp.]|uniref:SHOCT domain-containing protein n=1 Tax=Sulfurimonas sp. TaxID=2022749 RepID=UPI003567A26A
MHTFGMGFIWLILLFFVVAFVYLITKGNKHETTTKDILDKRYANGEINEHEYKTMKDELGL